MKKAPLLLLSCLLAFAVPAGERADTILKLLNTRTSSSPRAYALAAAEVAADARRGSLLPQFVVAVLSETSDWPASERLAPEVRTRYLENSAPRIKEMAEAGGNAFAWYLLYLKDRDETALQKAVTGGNVQALNLAGTSRLMAVLGSSSDDDLEAEGVKRTCFGYFRQAADMGDANGLNNLGLCHQNGYGCPKDEAAAFACFSKAAQQGHAEAVNNLGRFHREGICVKKDYVAALRCFRLSAGQGNVSGQLNYSLALIRGEGIEADPEKGLSQLESMASRGVEEAMDCLSECYARGVGKVEPDAKKSLYWMFRARAARGDANAAKWLKENDESTHDR